MIARRAPNPGPAIRAPVASLKVFPERNEHPSASLVRGNPGNVDSFTLVGHVLRRVFLFHRFRTVDGRVIYSGF